MADPTPAHDNQAVLVDRAARRVGSARLVLHRLPRSAWSVTVFLPRPGGDVYLTYHGDRLYDALWDCCEDPASDLRDLNSRAYGSGLEELLAA